MAPTAQAALTGTATTDPCAALSPVACENLRPGVPAAVWDDVTGAGDDTLQGFATSMSVDRGERIHFKIKTDATAYAITIYRLGWYQGHGARQVAGLTPSATLPQSQPACLTEPSTLLVDCGNWAVSAGWDVPADAVSGVYIAHLKRPDTGGSSHIPFIVRHDAGNSDIVFQTADTTWQAYNTYGGYNFYPGDQGRATKVSYNRPFTTRGHESGRDFLFGSEYAGIRFLERQGYDVSYIAGVDTHRTGSLLTNHRIFLSVGHDEYWSGQQRAHVEAARDAGVNLVFWSGNDVYWKTRWEPSIDGSGTALRTLVCYKETWSSAKVDPSPEWTGTWRDPRFSPPSDGGAPENALTGTLYMSNYTDLPITVSAAEGRTRLWRHTAAATQPDGGTLALAAHTVGYESNEDLDNGFRPAGLVRLSTTTGPTTQYLQDYGSTVAPGTTTHHVTMYRAPGGGRVFSAGTINWTWGLDQTHDGDGAPADPVIQQASVNLLADLGAAPTTLTGGLVATSASSDTTPPSVTIAAPAAGTAIANGAPVTVSGTATDVGGVVAGVEVSTDGGSRWHPAVGTSTWSYSYTQTGAGPVDVRVRAVDDSLNTGASVAVGLSVACPCSVFGGQPPTTVDSGDSAPVELGLRVRVGVSGWITGVRFYKASANTGTHVGSLWSTSGELLARGTFVDESTSGWQTLVFAAPVPVAAGTTVVVSYSAPAGHYSVSPEQLRRDVVAAPLTAPAATATEGNGVYGSLGTFPTNRYGAPSYGVDVVFSDVDTMAPTLVSTTPRAAAASVPVTVVPSAVLSEEAVAGSVAMSLATAQGYAVAGTSAYDPGTRVVSFTPQAALAPGTDYVATVQATDLAGNILAGGTFAFRSVLADQVPGVCPCMLWNDDDSPAISAYPDSTANELGLTFSTEIDGIVTGVRFYKGATNTGNHTGSLWTASGTLLATGVFTGESSEGWQTLVFSSPVAVTAATPYVVSYFAPHGHYAVDPQALATAGLSVSPLVVPTSGGAYRAGSSGFPASASGSSYGVQPVFTVPADLRPGVARQIPGPGATNVRVDLPLSATFDTLVQPGSAQLTVTGPDATPVPGTLTWSGSDRTVRFTPSQPLSPGTTYGVTVSGARSAGGALMTPVTSSFTSAGATACPCTTMASTATPAVADVGDGGAVSLGLRFVPTVDGHITGVRFFKSAANSGPHTGSLWSAAGVRLATGTFAQETATGWQTLVFPQAVEVQAGQTYLVSYFAPSGHYAAELDAVSSGWVNGPLTVPGGGNGVYGYGGDVLPTQSFRDANYFVDPIFQPGPAPDTTGPAVTARSPIADAGSVPVESAISVTFSEPIVPSTLVLTLAGPAGPVAGATAYDPATRTAVFTPSQPLARASVHTVTVAGADATGNGMTTAPWSFTTMQPPAVPGVCPCAAWDDTAVPAVIDVVDPSTVELGAAFWVDSPQRAVGLRFYKGTNNPGPHVASLWSTTGELLARATATGESSTGWQTVTFADAVVLTPGVTYVVSYLAPAGGYSATSGGLASGVDAAPVHIAAGGRYRYGGGFPGDLSSANYWVTPVVDSPPVVSQLVAAPGPGSLTVSWTTDEPSTAVLDYGTTPALGTRVALAGPATTQHGITVSGLQSETTYYYAVTSVDAVGLSTTAPQAPASVTTPDTIAPVVSAVTSTPGSTTGPSTTATISWTTDESATARVDYGTSATALTLTATGPSGTSHSVVLTGLTVNTRYYYRVTSVDAAGNATTSPAAGAAPASHVPPAVPLVLDTTADFATGTRSNSTVTTYGAGTVVLAAAYLNELNGTTLGTGLSSAALVSGGTTTVSGGAATLTGTRVLHATAQVATGAVTWTADLRSSDQRLGVMATNGFTDLAYFTRSSTGQLVVVANDGIYSNSSQVLTTNLTPGPHEYRIQFTPNTATFLVDGVQLAVLPYIPTDPLYAFASDSDRTNGGLVVDWVRAGVYAASGSYTSRVFDAGAAVVWDSLRADSTVPAGTTLVLRVRSGSTPTPGTGWTGWSAVPASGVVNRTSRYLQFQLVMTSTGTRFLSPSVAKATLAYHVI